MAERARRILVVEDEPALAEAVALNLQEEGYETTVATRGDEGLRLATSKPFDLVILDLMLPGMHGRDVCRRLREHSEVPVLMLTARTAVEDRVRGLGDGADDYIAKPFSMLELIARVKAHLRREETRQRTTDLEDQEVYSACGVVLDLGRREVTLNGAPVELRPKEFELLRALIANAGRVVPRDRLLDLVWGEHDYLDQGTLEVHVRWLRQKLEDDPSRPTRIVTIRSVGYKFSDG